MSTKKDQYLDSARKWIVKGQLDRAIKDYEQVIALDPTDMKHRQKLAELLVRVGRKVPAIKEYDVIGRYYAENGYFLKAIAVYKQIQKLDPEDLSICLKLADYNNKQGLTGNALAEYGVVLAHHQQTGNIKEAFNVLEKMIEVDPDNLDTLLKYAEARYGAGEWDDAYNDFSRLAMLLLKRGDKTWFNRICDRIRSLYPDRTEFFLNVLEVQVQGGETARAIPALQDILKRDRYNLAAWQLLIRAYRTAGDVANCQSALKYMVHFFPKELSVREELIELAAGQGKGEEALALTSAHLRAFLEQGSFDAAERLCHSLLPLVNAERISPLLQKVYEAGGEQEKLDALLGRAVHTVEVETSEEAAEPELDHAVPVSGDENADGGSDDELWEDEIDLSLLEILAGEGDAVLDASGKDEAVFAAEPAAPEGADEAVGEGPDILGLGDLAPLDWLAGPPSSAPGEELLFSEEDLPDFDEFSTALDDLFKDDIPEQPVSPGGKYDAEEVLAAFRQGLDAQLDASDSESHYDLGIAYKEMGLYDDAIKEFKRAAIGNPGRLVDCLTLQGMCYREKGEVEAAEEALKTAVEMENSDVDQQASAMYELALLYESAGQHDDARHMFRRVQELLPGFRDIAVKLGASPGGDGDVLDLEDLD